MAGPGFLQMLKGLFGAGPPPAAEPTVPEKAGPASAEKPLATSIAELDLSRVPAAAKARVETIQALVVELERRASARGFTGSDLAELTDIGTVYLPRLLTSYAEIPPQHRAEIFRDTGHSASFLLVERLDKVIERLNEISRDLAQNHLKTFSENIRFIDLRYGSPASPFD